MFRCDIFIDKDTEQILNLFRSELDSEDSEEPRKASYRIEKVDGNLMIRIEAKDVTALRAYSNTILKTIEVYHKVKGLN